MGNYVLATAILNRDCSVTFSILGSSTAEARNYIPTILGNFNPVLTLAHSVSRFLVESIAVTTIMFITYLLQTDMFTFRFYFRSHFVTISLSVYSGLGKIKVKLIDWKKSYTYIKSCIYEQYLKASIDCFYSQVDCQMCFR